MTLARRLCPASPNRPGASGAEAAGRSRGLEQTQKTVLAVLRRLAAKGVAHAVFLSDGTRTRERP